MSQTQSREKADGIKLISQNGLVVRGAPGVLTSSGAAKRLVFIKSHALTPQLQQFLSAGIRRVEVTALIDGMALTFTASITKRGAQHPLHLHPIGEAGKFLAEVYRQHRAGSGRRHNPVPMLILSVTPLLEKTSAGGGEV
jgi:hypothetical protein